MTPPTDSPQRLVEDALRAEPVKYLCEREPPIVEASLPVVDVLELLRKHEVGCVIVVDEVPDGDAVGGKPVGIFTERDVLDRWAVLDSDEWLSIKYNPIERHMSPSPRCLDSAVHLDEATQLMTKRGYRHLPITEEGELIGVLSAKGIVDYLAQYFPAEVFNLPPTPELESKFDKREGE